MSSIANKLRSNPLFITLALGLAMVSPAATACGSGSPVVNTDKADYDHYDTAIISGAGFDCGQVLYVLVTAPDGTTRSGNRTGSLGPDSVTTDSNGSFTLNYSLSGTLPGGGTYSGQIGTYRANVTNASGTILASFTFSDGGGFHSCAISTSGGVKCWGYNAYGELGDGTTTERSTPMNVVGLSSGVKEISLGWYHTCALTTSGGIKCWGYNGDGQLGNGTFTNSSTPVDVPGLTSGVAHVSGGSAHTCALLTSGGVRCWGYNYYGSLGNGTFSAPSATPGDVSGLTSGVVQLDSGGYHNCAVMTSGGVKCWGINDAGELGNGTYTTQGIALPVGVIGLTNVSQISAGSNHTCALTTSGGVKCWGYNRYGQIGNGSYATSSPYGTATPGDVSGLTSGVTQISASGAHSCAVTAAGGAKCWGRNDYGQVGNGTFSAIPGGITSPADVSGLTSGVAQIRGGVYHTCALTSSGGEKCWGQNIYGQLGNGTFTTVNTPRDVFGLTSGVADLPDLGDTIPPTASPTQAPSTNGAGWNNSDVTVTWHWTDNVGGSGTDNANCTMSSTSSGEGASVNVSATCKDLAGNIGNASYTVKVDKTNPTITQTATKADMSAYTGGTWTNQTVTVHYTCGDSLSGVSTCQSDQVFSTDTSTSLNGSATDVAGNSASSSFILVRVDKTNPTITASATKADSAPYTAGTWTNQTVTVHYTCTDTGGSGIATCPADQVLSASGTTASVNGTAADGAGNTASASFGPINVDKILPALSPVVSPNPVLLNGAATVTSGATDTLSGLAAQSCNAVVTNSVGTKTVTCTATDNAGNTNSAAVSYVVNYGFSGFLAPVNNPPVINTGKGGKTYPVKFQLTDSTKALISNLSAVSSTTYRSTSCSAFTGDPTDALETNSSGGSSLRYDATSGQFIYNWQTPGAGCYTLFITLDSGQVYSAYFNLN